MSEFGIIQITRQRVRQSILHRVTDLCPMCSGTGRVQSRAHFIKLIERWLGRYKHNRKSIFLKLFINPMQKSLLFKSTFKYKFKFFIKYFTFVKIETDDNMALDEFKFVTRKENIDITQEYGI
jgi:ribonuclease G